jgi:hypothetical protein
VATTLRWSLVARGHPAALHEEGDGERRFHWKKNRAMVALTVEWGKDAAAAVIWPLPVSSGNVVDKRWRWSEGGSLGGSCTDKRPWGKFLRRGRQLRRVGEEEGGGG